MGCIMAISHDVFQFVLLLCDSFILGFLSYHVCVAIMFLFFFGFDSNTCLMRGGMEKRICCFFWETKHSMYACNDEGVEEEKEMKSKSNTADKISSL
jgi:hypothetical protein